METATSKIVSMGTHIKSLLFSDFCNFLLKVSGNALPTSLTKAQYRFCRVQK